MPEIHNPLVSASILSITTGIDLKTTGAVALYTVPTGRRAIVTGIIIHTTAATAFTVAPSASFGQNSTNYDDMVGITALTGVNALDEVYVINPSGAFVSVAAAAVINCNITTGATATTATAEIVLLGFLV